MAPPQGLIVAVTGLPGSGKSVAARIIAEELGVEVRVMGDVVREETVRRGLEPTPENVERVARTLREELGRAAVARLLIERLEPGRSYVLDGLRSVEEAEVLASAGWRVFVVGVYAPRKRRLERLMRRRRAGETLEEVLALRDASNLKLGVGEALALSDYLIVNTGSLEDLELEARRAARVAACGGDP
ncbi:AAA family ATPase [Aeropyrum camini]|uniref:UPF0200 protein ACAM_1101 n=1 Tax=Aeropyrum camini SY1 = JCM 12091 TaxID=1198449 RepID=U3TEW1_9CREN|nr:AAA family ATPase [Aeropyrum camini]BAN90570.1 dephospho-CoA kinase [Aeropyrum camini SY1 = JCM 12091]